MRSILIIDDHPLMLDALKQLIKTLPFQLEIVSAYTAEAGLEMIKNNSIQNLELVIIDFGLPLLTGYSAITAFKRLVKNIPIIVISGNEDTQIVRQIHHYGIAAYISKSTKPEIICSTISDVLNGKSDPALAAIALPEDEISNLRQTFTKMEVRVLMLINKGYSNKQIAEHFQLKEISVKKHISNIFHKLNVRNRVHVIKEIQRLGLFQNDTESESI